MVLVDGCGIPLSLIVTGANRHDVSQVAATLDAIVVPRPPSRRARPLHLCADAGFVGDPALPSARIDCLDFQPRRGRELANLSRSRTCCAASAIWALSSH